MREAIVDFLWCHARSWLRILTTFAGIFLMALVFAAMCGASDRLALKIAAIVAFFGCIASLLARLLVLLYGAVAARDWMALALGGLLGLSVAGGIAFSLMKY